MEPLTNRSRNVDIAPNPIKSDANSFELTMNVEVER